MKRDEAAPRARSHARHTLRPHALLLLSLALSACTPSPEQERETRPLDPERQRIVRFWETFNAATKVRTSGDCPGAVPLYEEALALNPEHEECLYYLGQCRRELGEPAEARALFERLVELNPESARGHLSLGALLASPDSAEPMDLEAAERHLRRAHAINREETGPVVRLGEVALVTGRVDEAGALFEAALLTNAQSVEAALLAGYLSRGAGGGDEGTLVERIRDAARVEGPIKGVLNEGDRIDETGKAARPLAHPLGRLLFGAPADGLRTAAAGGTALSDDAVRQAWDEVDRLLRAYQAR